MKDHKETQPGEQAPECPPEAVQNLKAAREAKGLSLKDVFKATRVSTINLTAVENETFDRLPPSVYARNFIRKYARAVGIDDKPVLKRYDNYLESLKPPREETEIQKPWPETGRRNRFLFLSLAAVTIAGLSVYVLFLYDQSTGKAPATTMETPQQAAPVKTEPIPQPPAPAPPTPPAVTEPPAPAARTVPAVQPKPATIPTSAPVAKAIPVAPAVPPPQSTQAAAPAPAKAYRLVIETHELTWIRISADRNPPYQILLKPGDKIERTASDYFQLDIGNAGGIDITFQGKSLGRLGKQGETIHMRLPEKAPEKPEKKEP